MHIARDSHRFVQKLTTIWWVHNGASKEAAMSKLQIFYLIMTFGLLAGVSTAMGAPLGALPWIILGAGMWWVKRKR